MDGQNFNNNQDQNNQYYNQQYTSYPYQQQIVEPPKKTPTLAIVSLVMGILSIVLGCCYGIGLIFAIVGIVLSILSNREQSSGVGIAGLVCSIVGVIFSVIMIVFYVSVFKSMMADPSFKDLFDLYSTY